MVRAIMPAVITKKIYYDAGLFGARNRVQYYEMPVFWTAANIRSLHNAAPFNLTSSQYGAPFLADNANNQGVSGFTGGAYSPAGLAAGTQQLITATGHPGSDLDPPSTSTEITAGPRYEGFGVRDLGYLLVKRCVEKYVFMNPTNAAEYVEFYYISPKGWRDGDYSLSGPNYNSTTTRGTTNRSIVDTPTNFAFFGCKESYGSGNINVWTTTATGAANTLPAGGVSNQATPLVSFPQNRDDLPQSIFGANENATIETTKIARNKYDYTYANTTEDNFSLQMPTGFPFGESTLFKRHWKIYAVKRYRLPPGKHITVTVSWKKPFRWPMQKLASSAEYAGTNAVLGPKQKRLIVAMRGMTYSGAEGAATKNTVGLQRTALHYTKVTHVEYTREPSMHGRSWITNGDFSLVTPAAIPAKIITQQPAAAGNEVPEQN